MTTLEVERVLLTVNQSCEALGVSRSTLYELIGRGELRIVKLGRGRRSGVRIRPKDLHEFADRHAAQTSQSRG